MKNAFVYSQIILFCFISLCVGQVDVEVKNGKETVSPSIITVNTNNPKTVVWVRKTLFERLQTYELKTTSKDIRQYVVVGPAGRYSVEVWVDGTPTLAELVIEPAKLEPVPIDDEKPIDDKTEPAPNGIPKYDFLYVVDETSTRTAQTAKLLSSDYWLSLKAKGVEWRVFDPDDAAVLAVIPKIAGKYPALVYLLKSGKVTGVVEFPKTIEGLKKAVGK